MLTTRTLKLSLIAAAIAAFGGQALAQQTPQSPAAPASQVVRPADLMTQQERDAFRKQMEQATTADERQKVRDAHRAMLEQRARDKGVTLAGPGYGPGGPGGDGRGPGYGPRGPGGPGGPGAGPRGDGPMSQLFTQAERDQMRDRMHAAQTTEERQKLRDEFRLLAEVRAKEKGITLPQPGQGPRGGHRHGPGGQQPQQPAPQS
jgi:Spy/CpxP family protein refolding chaperone